LLQQLQGEDKLSPYNTLLTNNHESNPSTSR